MRRQGALVGAAGVHHVASRLAFEGFRVALTGGRISHADMLVSLAGRSRGSSAAAIQVKTSGWAMRMKGGVGAIHHYEWDMGRTITHVNDPRLFVAFVDLKRMERLPDVFLFPSTELHGYCESLGNSERCRYRPLVEEIEPHRNNWRILEDRLHEARDARTGRILREWLEEQYGEEFAQELDAEASRLLGAKNSSIHQMADEHLSARELAEASALLRILFRHRKE